MYLFREKRNRIKRYIVWFSKFFLIIFFISYQIYFSMYIFKFKIFYLNKEMLRKIKTYISEMGVITI